MAENMKPSGIAWIGDIPESWKTKRVKFLISDIKDGTHGTFDRVDSGELLLSAKNVFDDKIVINENESEISQKDYKQIVCNGFPIKGDVLLCCVGTIGRTCVYQLEKTMAFQRSVAFLRPNKNTNSYLLKYCLQSDSTLTQEKFLINKSAQDGLYMGSIKELIVSYTENKREQTIIADFLNKKCAKIDSISADLEKQIELLEKYKKSLITETVTKGLNKNAPMKYSGIEWIGKIPEYWEVQPIKYKTTFYNGDRGENYPSKAEMTSEGIPFINAGHLLNGSLDMENMDYITQDKYKMMGGVKLKPDDILYCLRGSIGKNSIISINAGTVASSLVAIRSTGLLAKYLYYSFNSNIEEVQRILWDNGTAQPNLSAENLSKFKICLPPLTEQAQIANFLDKKCGEIDSIIESKKEQAELMKKHKQSIIYEYVTGKKRVTEVQSKWLSKVVN